MWLLRLAWLLLLSPLYASDGFPYELSICAIFRDEAPYLKEWLELHKLIGVERFYLFNNGSTDDYLTVLQAYIDQNEVEPIDWPSPRGRGLDPLPRKCLSTLPRSHPGHHQMARLPRYR